MSKIINPKKVPELMKRKAYLYKIVDHYINTYKATGDRKAAGMIKRITAEMKDINAQLGITHLPRINGISRLAKEAVGGSKSTKSA